MVRIAWFRGANFSFNKFPLGAALVQGLHTSANDTRTQQDKLVAGWCLRERQYLCAVRGDKKDERVEGCLSAVTSGALAVGRSYAAPQSTHESEPILLPIQQFSRPAAHSRQACSHIAFPALYGKSALA
jgi:hypothetical protein